jgi:hypothetical protein
MPNPLEDPIPVIVFGIIAVAVLGIALLRTGRGVLIAAIVGALVLTALGIGLEWLVVTEVERVQATLYGTAAALEANLPADDPSSVLAHISDVPQANRTQSKARRALKEVTFEKITIRNLRIEINDNTSPPTARASFKAFVTARLKSGAFSEMGRAYPIDFHLELRRESGAWKICDHKLENAPGGY